MIGASFVYFDIGISVSELDISYAQLINQNGEPEDLFLKLKLLVFILFNFNFLISYSLYIST